MRVSRTTILAVMAALACASVAGPMPSAAQDFEEDGYGPGDDDEIAERRRFRRYGGGGQGGNICVTSRGNCLVPPAPYNAACGCVIPGFGPKRGQIGD